MCLATERALFPSLQRLLLRAPLRSRGASARSLFGFHIRLPRISAYLVRRAVSARVENHVRGDEKFLGGGDARDRPAGHGGDGLSLPQYSRIQSKTAGRSLSKGGPVDRIIDSDSNSFIVYQNFASF